MDHGIWCGRGITECLYYYDGEKNEGFFVTRVERRRTGTAGTAGAAAPDDEPPSPDAAGGGTGGNAAPGPDDTIDISLSNISCSSSAILFISGVSTVW